MPPITLSTVVKLAILSIVLGAIMAFFGWQPMDIFRWLGDLIGDFGRNIQHYTGAAISYFLLGAVVVVPIWLVFYLIRSLGKKS